MNPTRHMSWHNGAGPVRLSYVGFEKWSENFLHSSLSVTYIIVIHVRSSQRLESDLRKGEWYGDCFLRQKVFPLSYYLSRFCVPVIESISTLFLPTLLLRD